MKKHSTLTTVLGISMILLVTLTVIVCIAVLGENPSQVEQESKDSSKVVFVYDGPYDLPDSINLMIDTTRAQGDTVYLIPNHEAAGY